jgi:hypothetical protein
VLHVAFWVDQTAVDADRVTADLAEKIWEATTAGKAAAPEQSSTE